MDAPARSVGHPKKIPEDPPGGDGGSAWLMPNTVGPMMGGAGAVVDWEGALALPKISVFTPNLAAEPIDRIGDPSGEVLMGSLLI